MEGTKLLLTVVVLLASFALVPSEAQACPSWVKLNTSPVCFGAKGNSYGSFKYGKNIFAKTFMLVHRSGSVTCNNKHYSYWGCNANHPAITAVITDGKNRVLAPSAPALVPGRKGWYTLTGFTSSSSALVLCEQKTPVCVHSSTELRLWYGEDLYGSTESDNAGKTCADVYAALI